MKATIQRLYSKMESLIAKYEAVNEQHHLSLSRIEELSKEIELHEQAIKQLEEKNKILKLSTSIQSEQGDNKAARKKINELVREIDKCIALLNK
jgi:predicted  nucleic acid-binding Zn-ribbon protein|tara:strand:- start:42 stop:323 length:282 start_codon:yes stop_codon:yes gene_type:complete